MRKKQDSRSHGQQKPSANSQLELLLIHRDLAAATVIQFPNRPKSASTSLADAKRRLLEFATRLPD
jgi:hypothetical protein